MSADERDRAGVSTNNVVSQNPDRIRALVIHRHSTYSSVSAGPAHDTLEWRVWLDWDILSTAQAPDKVSASYPWRSGPRSHSSRSLHALESSWDLTSRLLRASLMPMSGQTPLS